MLLHDGNDRSSRLGTKGQVEDKTKIVDHTDDDKKRTDDLWSAFKADVAMPIKRWVRFLKLRSIVLNSTLSTIFV